MYSALYFISHYKKINDIEKKRLKENFVQQNIRAQVAYSFNYFQTLMTRSIGQTQEVVTINV